MRVDAVVKDSHSLLLFAQQISKLNNKCLDIFLSAFIVVLESKAAHHTSHGFFTK